ncbi:hypothetical protein RDWZM_008794 [Blomia tropicalis]|uniref:Uncharacterized protein n=1 Tax=Blomia tropicalis TaxID=40697 RepID=A0A9Q0M538_BLOTA|nr:hypothetical protein RDWZM_008794 [Blomia tropicalis]
MDLQPSDNILKSSSPSFEIPSISIAEYYVEQTKKFDSNQLAIIDHIHNEQITFNELHIRAQSFANGLLKKGIGKNDFVIFFADNHLEYIVSMLGVIYLGIPFSHVKSANGAYELAGQIIDAKGTVLVLNKTKIPILLQMVDNSEYSQALNCLNHLVLIGNDQINDFGEKINKTTLTYAELVSAIENLPKIPYFPFNNMETEPFMIFYTSGTTGKPKGAIYSNRSYLSWLINLKMKKDFRGKRTLISNPLGHVSGKCYSLLALLDGLTVVLLDSSCSIDDMLKAVEKYQVNHLIFGANHAADLANTDFEKIYNLKSLELMKYGSTKISGDLLIRIKNKYNVKMFEVYGSTEFWGHLEYKDWSQLDENFVPHSLGSVAPNVEMKIIDLETGKALPPHQNGEVCFRGPNCFVGYLNNPSATKETIDDEGWYHSGDIGYYDENGHLFVADRIKELIKFRLWTVIPGEIELCIHQNPSVMAVCVVGVPHITDGNHIRAYVQLKEDAIVSEQELIDYIKDNMGFQKRLRAGVCFVPEIVRNQIGKVDKQYYKQLVKGELLTEQVE